MSYTPVYVLIALVLIVAAAMFGLRFLGRRRGARHQRRQDAFRARIDETWARRNDPRPD